MEFQLDENFRALIESTDDLIWSVDHEHRLTTCNSAFLRHALANFALGTGIESGLEELAPVNMASVFGSFYDRAMAEGAFRVGHFQLDGLTLEMAFKPNRNGEKVTGVSVIAKEVTLGSAAEDPFGEAESIYRDLFEGAIEGIYRSSLDGKLLNLNMAMARMLGYNSPRECQTTVNDLAHDVWADPEERSKYLRLLEENGELRGYECQCKRKDGTIVWVSLKVRKVHGQDGHPPFYQGFVEDISGRRLAIQVLAERELLFRQFFQVNGSVMLLIDPADGAIVNANPAAAAYYGFTRKQLTAMTIGQINVLPPEDVFAEWHKAFDKEENHFNFPHRLASGELRDVEVYSSPVTVAGRQLLFSIVHDITERNRATLKLADSEERFRATFEQAAVGILHASLEGKFLRCNQRFAEIIGYAVEEIPGLTIQQITCAEDIPASMETLSNLGNGIIPSARWEKRYIRRNGTLVWGRLTSSIQRNSEGRPLHFITLVEDIDALKAAEQQLAATQAALLASEARYRYAFQTSETRYRAAFEVNHDPSAISRLDDGTYIEVNPEFGRVLGYEREEAVGKTSRELRIFPLDGDREIMADTLRRDGVCRDVKLTFRRKNGEVFWGAMSASLIELDGVPHIFSCVRDLSSTLAAESEIYNLAFLDPLTNLPNRRLLFDELRRAQSNAARSGLKQTLLLLDLDNFKALNDSLGHPVGDLMLQEVAHRISSCVDKADTVARIGGDEFAVMLKDLSRIPEEVAAHAKMVADKILAAIDQPFLLEGHELHGTASVGVTVFGDPSDSTNEILQQAEIALYQAKSAGRNTVKYFAPTLLEAAIASAALEADLRLAIDKKQFLLYYQPQIMNGCLASVESLIRWQHPGRGLMLPNDFIPLAEQTGLVVAIGVWGLETACKQLVEWAAREETAHLRIALNISARHFCQPDFVDQVVKVLELTGAVAANLELEITESVMVEDFKGIIAKMTELKSHGVRFSLDDFGTGYSSLSYLKRLPLDHLKIDISFIREILTDSTSAEIARAIISMGQAMALPVIAEGVETEEQRGFLSGLGCHGFQGHLVSRPLPLREFEEFLSKFPGPEVGARS